MHLSYILFLPLNIWANLTYTPLLVSTTPTAHPILLIPLPKYTPLLIQTSPATQIGLSRFGFQGSEMIHLNA